MRATNGVFLLAGFSILGANSSSRAQEPPPLPFGSEYGDISTAPNDDGSSVAINLPHPMFFFGETVSTVYQHTNGAITFDSSYPRYTPEKIPSVSVPPMVAIYWTDIDTRNGGEDQNELWAGSSTRSTDLDISSELVRGTKVDASAKAFTATGIFVATWNKVEAFRQASGAQNTFQLIITSDGTETWAIFAYRQLEFFTTNSATKTVVGFNDRQGIEGTLIGEILMEDDMEALITGTNCGVNGTYAFRISEGIQLTGCGVLNNEPVLRPFYGPQTGGTVIQIQNLPICIASDESVEIYCQFRGEPLFYSEIAFPGYREAHSGIVLPGYRVNEGTIECVTPYASSQGYIEVEYTAHDPLVDGTFNPRTADWVSTPRRFQFTEEALVGVYRLDSLSLVFRADEDVTFNWNAAELLQSAEESLNRGVAEGSIEDQSDIHVDVEVVTADETTLLLLQSETLSQNDISSYQANIPEASIASYFLPIGQGGQAAVVIIRVVAWIMDPNGVRRVGAARASPMMSVIPAESLYLRGDQRRTGTLCKLYLTPKDECQDRDMLTPCPPDVLAVQNDRSRFQPDDVCRYPYGLHDCDWGRALVFEQYKWACLCQHLHGNRADPSQPGAAGCWNSVADENQCCYGANGALITEADRGAGTPDCTAGGSSLDHFWEDVVPFEVCCTLTDSCDEYFEQRLSPDDGEGYELPPPPGRTYPHLRSMDGLEFDFNGAGEYVAFCGIAGEGPLPVPDLIDVCSPDLSRLVPGRNTLSVHYRFAQPSVGAEGTITVAVAIEDPLHRSGESALVIVPHHVRGVDVYDGNTRIEFPPYSTSTDMTSTVLETGAKITRTVDRGSGTIKIVVDTPSGLTLEVREVAGVMLPLIHVPENIRQGRAIGLLGLVDGDSSNDLIDSKGTPVNPPASFTGAELAEFIFNLFGQTWMIYPRTRSLFQAFEGSEQSWESFYNPGFVPAFEQPRMAPALESEAFRACSGIEDESIRAKCFYDAASMQDASTVGKVANAAVKQQDEIIEVLTNHRPEILLGESNDQEVTVFLGEATSFTVLVTDEDSDPLTLTLDRNDGGLFSFTAAGDSGGILEFSGSNTEGVFTGQVLITDGTAPILYTVKVTAESTSAPTTATSQPSTAPTVDPVNDGCLHLPWRYFTNLFN